MDKTFRLQKSMFDHVITPDTIPPSFQKIESRRSDTRTRSLLSAKVMRNSTTTSSSVSSVDGNPSRSSSYVSEIEDPSITFDTSQADLNNNNNSKKAHPNHHNNNEHLDNTMQKFSRAETEGPIPTNERPTHPEIIIAAKSKMDEIKPDLNLNNENLSTSSIRKDDNNDGGEDAPQKSPDTSNLPQPTNSVAEAAASLSDKSTTEIFQSIPPSATESMKENIKSVQASATPLSSDDNNVTTTSMEKNMEQHVVGHNLQPPDLDVSSSLSSSSSKVTPKPDSNSPALFIPSFANFQKEEMQQKKEEEDDERQGQPQQHLKALQPIIGHPLISKLFTSNTNETIVNVNIGRIEIKAVTPSQQTPTITTTTSPDQTSTRTTIGAYSPPLSLAEYLKRRADEGKRKG